MEDKKFNLDKVAEVLKDKGLCFWDNDIGVIFVYISNHKYIFRMNETPSSPGGEVLIKECKFINMNEEAWIETNYVARSKNGLIVILRSLGLVYGN